MVVRANVDPVSLVPTLQRQVWTIDKDQPITAVRTLERLLHDSVSRQRFNMLLFAVFGAVGLVLASVGIYGVLSYTVSQRIHEIGIRMALGAKRGQILAMVITHGMGLALLSVAIGAAAALALTRVMSTLLFRITTTDPATFLSVSVLLLGVAFAACYIPAWKANQGRSAGRTAVRVGQGILACPWSFCIFLTTLVLVMGYNLGNVLYGGFRPS